MLWEDSRYLIVCIILLLHLSSVLMLLSAVNKNSQSELFPQLFHSELSLTQKSSILLFCTSTVMIYITETPYNS